MPDDMAVEKSELLLKLGAEVERVRPAPIVDQNQFVNLARTRALEHTIDEDKPGRGLFADQFETEANWRAHYAGTGPEIYDQTGGRLDAFVSGAGTGGTISGVAKFLKERLPGLKVVLADPPGSGLYNKVKFGVMFDPKEKEGTRRRHQVDTIVEGIGINRLTHNFEIGRELVDDAIRVDDDQALAMARWLVENDGIFVGSSSAVNCKCEHKPSLYVLTRVGVAATKLAKQLGPGHRIVTLLCDR
jgi:cysteine synthase A